VISCHFMIWMFWHQVFFIPKYGTSWHVCSPSLWVLHVFLFFSEFWPIFSLSCPRRRFSLCVLQPKDPEVMPGTSFNLINESTYFW
jgi:peptidoglycan/LPS O-acetylase OafA/YrhL